MTVPETLLPVDKRAQLAINVVSGVVCAVVAFLILGPRPSWAVGMVDVSALPAVNASFNGLTGVLLVAGFAAIKAGRQRLHKSLMISAFASSTMFLVSYVTYHWFSAGPAHYEGGWRGIYLAILGSHIVLAAVILPFALTTLLRGLTGRIVAHKRVAPGTLAMWLYVSVTGVTIYWMLY